MTLNEIYDWIVQNIDFFKGEGATNSSGKGCCYNCRMWHVTGVNLSKPIQLDGKIQLGTIYHYMLSLWKNPKYEIFITFQTVHFYRAF